MPLKTPIEVRSFKVGTLVVSAPAISEVDTGTARILNVKDGNIKCLVIKGQGVDLRELNLERHGRKGPEVEITSPEIAKAANATR